MNSTQEFDFARFLDTQIKRSSARIERAKQGEYNDVPVKDDQRYILTEPDAKLARMHELHRRLVRKRKEVACRSQDGIWDSSTGTCRYTNLPDTHTQSAN